MAEIKSSRLILLFLVIVSVIFHLFNLTKPDKPVFDEAHFATYATGYAQGKPVFDIHPPLGKAIFALPLLFSGANSFVDVKFVDFEKNELTGDFIFSVFPKNYQDFPYLLLRLISVFFGAFLVLAVYWLVKAVSGSELAALLSAFFITFENALLLETRLILLDGIYLVFGFLALAIFFKEKSRPLWAGLIWGLALSVKLVAVVFLGPVIIYSLLKNKNLFSFLIGGLGIFLLVVIFMNGFFIPVGERLNFYQSLGLPFAGRLLTSPLGQNFQAALVELNISLSGYTGGVRPHPAQSQWYEWPFMIKPIKYSEFGNKILALIGNPAVWFLSIAAVFLSLVRFKKTSLILLAGYVFSLIPFIFVSRPAFLYHYFPALIFGISLASVLIAGHLKTLSLPAKKKWLGGLIGFVVLFFIITSPYTFGL